MVFYDRLDVRRVNILATRNNHVFLAIDNIQIAALVNAANIAGTNPAPTLVIGAGRLSIGIVAIQVTGHYQSSIAEYFAAFACRNFTIIVIDDADVLSRAGSSD